MIDPHTIYLLMTSSNILANRPMNYEFEKVHVRRITFNNIINRESEKKSKFIDV